MPVTINREMTITRDEFFRILPKALSEFSFEIYNDKIICRVEEGLIEINISKGENRMLGALKLPVLNIKFVMNNISREMQTRFFEKFYFAYQKGGG